MQALSLTVENTTARPFQLLAPFSVSMRPGRNGVERSGQNWLIALIGSANTSLRQCEDDLKML